MGFFYDMVPETLFLRVSWNGNSGKEKWQRTMHRVLRNKKLSLQWRVDAESMLYSHSSIPLAHNTKRHHSSFEYGS